MAFVRLDEVIKRVHTKVDKDNTDLIYYVGGEHIDSEIIRVTKRGLIEGSTIGPMFYYGFKAGDFLLVSRNPHLKKAGVVGFDGICSEKTFVLNTVDERRLLPEFLPFILQNDLFWDYAYRHRHGSTNTFINWSTLASYEFELPDLDTQRQLATVLWSINDTMEAYKKLISATDELVKSQFIVMFGNPLLNEMKWPVQKMKDVAPSSPYNGNISSNGKLYWLLNLDMVESNTGRIIDKVYVPMDEIGPSTTTFSSEYVLFSKLRPYLNKVVIPDDSGYATTELIPMLPNPGLLKQVYLAQMLRGDEFLTFISAQVSGTKMPRVTMNVFWDFEVMLPPLELQEQFASFVQQSDKSKFELEQALSELTATYKRIISENLG